MRKIWVIAQRELWQSYTDVNLLLIMLVTPLALATIIGLAFSGINGGNAGISDIPVAIVNQDNGDYGKRLVNIFLPDQPSASFVTDGNTVCEQATPSDAANTVSITDLTEATLLDDPEAARLAVQNGDYAAAIIIPPDFSANIAYSTDNPQITPTTLTVYADPGRSVSPEIIRGITESITYQMVGGNISIAATIDTLIEYAPLRPIFGTYFIGLGLTGNFQPDFSCAFDPNFNTVQLDRQTIAGEESIFNPLVVFGSAQAMFFLLFTAQGSAGSIMELRREGVLQRMMVTPTPLISVLLGQMLGTFLIGLVQLVILSLAFTLVGSVIAGAFSPIWGGNLLLIGVVLVAAALSASGLGILLSGIASTPEQASIIGTVINMVMGVLGGAFFAAPQIPALQPFLWVSLVYWCSNALQTLAAGRGDVLLPVLVMGVIGVVTFFAGLMVFRRRLAS